MHGVSGSRRYAIHLAQNVFLLEGDCLIKPLAFNQAHQRGAARHRGDTSFGPKAHLLHHTILDLCREFENVAAGGVIHADARVGVRQITGIAGVFEVFEEPGGIHSVYFTKNTHPGVPRTRSILGGMTERSHLRVASLQPSITVTLDRLGVLDRLVACTRYCADVAPAVRQSGAHIIHDSWTAKADEILASKPDIVIASVPYQLEAVAEILKSGVRFLGFAPHSLHDIYGDIVTLASLMDVPDRGEALIREMQNAIASARERTRELPKLRVFCEEWGKPLIHSQAWIAELVDAAGGEFLGTPGAHTDAAAVQALDPEVVLAAWCGAGDRVPLEKIIRERRWEQTTAARTRRVFCINDELFNTPGPTLIEGLHAILYALHPQHFPPAPGIRQIAADL